MALYPGAVKKLIPPGANDPKIDVRAVVLHVDAGNAHTLFDYFKNRSGGLESHFFVRTDGVVEQYRDTGWQADAAYASNDFAIQIETQGFGEGDWSPAQLKSIKKLLAWAHTTHQVPLRKIARFNGSGVGYHSQFSQWNHSGHSCPGPNRIRQFGSVLVPWMDRQTKPKLSTAFQLRVLTKLLALYADQPRTKARIQAWIAAVKAKA